MANAKLNGWLWRIVFLAAGLIFGAGVTYGVVLNRLDSLTNKVDDHEGRMRTVESAFGRIEIKLDYLIEQGE